MHEVLQELIKRWRNGESVGLGTVVATFRSAPRPPGASMMIGADGAAVGSLSGGCVEGAVYDLAQSVMSSGRPVLQRYGVSDDDAFAVGLTCGGMIDVYVEKVDQSTFPELDEVADDVEAGQPVAIATVVDHPDLRAIGRRMVVRPDPTGSARLQGTLGLAVADETVATDALDLLADGLDAAITYDHDGRRHGAALRIFISTFAPKPRLLVFGAIDFAAAVAQIGVFLGYHVTVCDARPVFATRSRLPHADEVVVDWPHRYLDGEYRCGRIDSRTAVTVLTHEPKFDVPLLAMALRMPELAYVGAMGSRRTHSKRLDQLRDNGLTEAELDRLYSPIGLDLGARTTQETAISIVAEIIAARGRNSRRHLKDSTGPIHEQSATGVAPHVKSGATSSSSASR